MKYMDRDIRKSNGEKYRRLLFFRWAALVMILIVVVFCLLQALIPDREYSETENRNLQTRPSIGLTQILSGRYSSDMETYAADQFPFRTAWIQIKGLSDRILGKTKSNNIFLSKKGYLIEDFTPAAPENYAAMTASLKHFAKKEKKLAQYMMIIPTAVNIYQELLPGLADAGDQNAFLDQLKSDADDLGISFIDVRYAFREAEDIQLYYKTDHHWTTDGAYLAYQQFAKAAGLEDTQAADDSEKAVSYKRVVAADDFCGTMAASSGFRMWEKDEICIYLPENSHVQYSVNYVSEAKTSASFYETEQLDVRDKYSVFMGGNHPLVKINTTADTGKVLLVLKDSYANCFVPFLTEHYDKILVVDPRYYYDDLEALISTEKITDVLYLYNANGFAGDTSLVTVLGDDLT